MFLLRRFTDKMKSIRLGAEFISATQTYTTEIPLALPSVWNLFSFAKNH